MGMVRRLLQRRGRDLSEGGDDAVSVLDEAGD